MKLVCLDIDGVLNNDESTKTDSKTGSSVGLKPGFAALDPACIARVAKICELTGAKILITTSWRKYYTQDELVTIFKHHGLTAEVVGFTPVFRSRERGDEIKAWFKTHRLSGGEAIKSFVILDDDDDMGSLFPYLVKTGEFGLLDQHVEVAVRILNAPPFL